MISRSTKRWEYCKAKLFLFSKLEGRWFSQITDLVVIKYGVHVSISMLGGLQVMTPSERVPIRTKKKNEREKDSLIPAHVWLVLGHFPFRKIPILCKRTCYSLGVLLKTMKGKEEVVCTREIFKHVSKTWRSHEVKCALGGCFSLPDLSLDHLLPWLWENNQRGRVNNYRFPQQVPASNSLYLSLFVLRMVSQLGQPGVTGRVTWANALKVICRWEFATVRLLYCSSSLTVGTGKGVI